MIPRWCRWLCFLMLAAGCRREEPVAPTPVAPAGVALVDGAPVSRDDVEAELSRRAASGAPADFDAVLEELLQRRRLVAAARRLGLDEDPAVRRTLEGVLIARLREVELEPRLAATNRAAETGSPAPAPAASTAAGKEPRVQTRVAWLRLQWTPRTSEARRGELLRRMRDARARALGLDASTEGFGELAIEGSDDDATRSAGGDLGWRTGFAEPEVADAVAALARPGDVSPVIEGRHGVYLLRLISRRDAGGLATATRGAGAVASHLAQRARREATEKAWADEIRARIPVEVQTNDLRSVRAAWESRRATAPPPPGGTP